MKANSELIKANGLIYPDLSYRIMSVLFKVHNQLGPNFQEKYYQRAIEIEFKAEHISFNRERMVPLKYGGESIGRYFIDFVIGDKGF
ncbi:MAG: GxxExxY protein [Candidatus Curtissbacteria bacterium]|nr:GxxExxY protein [Candidatus Curtissbacteria bacterium]